MPAKIRREPAECTNKCRSKEDAARLITVATDEGTEESVVLHRLVAAGVCSQPARVSDRHGRTLLHAAASSGRKRVVEWLVRVKEAALNPKDAESGYTALHRAIYSGQIHVAEYLLDRGANSALADHEGLTAFDLALMDKQTTLDLNPLSSPSEVYAWGANANFNLGISSRQGRQSPDVLEHFRREGINIWKVTMQKFHSAFLSTAGEVFTCGHGRGGRLGHGNEQPQLAPRRVKDLPGGQSCSDAALGVDHSVFLAESGVVLTCGSNVYHQLGQNSTPNEVTLPAAVYLGKQGQGQSKGVIAIGIGAARFHSLFWTKDSVFTWGLNAGQLGHLKGEKTTPHPKLVSSLNEKDVKIDRVATSDGAIVVLTAAGDILALHEYKTRRINRQHGVVKIEVVGGHLDPMVTSGINGEFGFKLVERGGRDLRVFVLNNTGRISVWDERRGGQALFNCVFNVSRDVSVADIAVSGKTGGLLIIAKDGTGFEGVHQANKSPAAAGLKAVKKSSREEKDSTLAQFVARSQTDMIKLRRIPGIFRGAACATDPKGQNFCVLQQQPIAALYDIPDVSPPTIAADMAAFADQTSEDDPICDVVFVIVGKSNLDRVPAHKYIMASASDKISKMMRSANGKEVTIEDVDPEIFRQVVKYCYTKTCALLKPGVCHVRLTNPKRRGEKTETACSSPDPDPSAVNDPERVSAFSVMQKAKKGKGKKGKLPKESPPPHQLADNPLEELLEASQELAVHGLTKAAEHFRMSTDNVITLKDGGKMPRAPPFYSRKSFPEHHDVVITTSDDEEVYAHRCLLASRLEYFRSMFCLGWIETSGENRRLNLPLPGRVVRAVLEFLYRDECAAVSTSDADTEFVCNVLVAADQFLIPRLVELCERQLVQLLTLKSAAEMLQFAFDYGAKQLARSTMQFLSQNMAAALESRILCALSDDNVERLTEYYRASVPGMARRRMRCGAKSLPSFEMSDADCGITAEDILSEELSIAAEECAAAKTSAAKSNLGSAGKRRNRRNSSGDGRRRKRSDSGSSVKSDSSVKSGGSSGTEGGDGGINNSHSGSCLSLDDFDFAEKDHPETECKLGGAEFRSEADNGGGDFLAAFFRSSNLDKSPPTETVSRNSAAPKKFAKKSQKERKRDQQKPQEDERDLAVANPKERWSGWGSKSPSESSPSFTNILTNEKAAKGHGELYSSGTKPKSVAGAGAGAGAGGSGRNRKASWRQLSFDEESSPATAVNVKSAQPPANPWKQLSAAKDLSARDEGEIGGDMQRAASSAAFSAIVQSQRERHLERQEMTSKSLHALQIEERAMAELLRAASGNPSERVKVVRVEKPMDPPIWNLSKR